MDHKKVTNCRACGYANLTRYLDLGSVPLCNNLDGSHKYPIEVLLCEDCYLSQLSVVVDPKILYSNYYYHSSVSQTFRDHCYDLALKLKSEFKNSDYPLVVDIASNDGCLLKEFRRAGFERFLGFEPAKNLASEPYGFREYVDEKTDDHPIPTVNAFFSNDTAHRIKGDAIGGRASFVIAQNVFAHVDDIKDFLMGVEWFLDDNGVFIVEVPHLANLIRENQFDTIYHEHLSYFLLRPLVRLFSESGLPIFRVEKLSIHGGSLRIYASKNAYPKESSVGEMLDSEEMGGYYDISTYISFGSKVDSVRTSLQNTLLSLYNEDKKVMGYGASAKGISLLNYCHIQNNLIHSIVDDTPDKQGKTTPGSRIPIVDFSHFENEKPDYILMLAWNFAPEMVCKVLKNTKLDPRFIIPIPEVKIF